MIHTSPTPVSTTFDFHSSDSPAVAQPAPGMVEERLPFTVRLVRSAEDLNKAVQIRHSAYARHMPGFAEKLETPEPDDTKSDSVVLLAESKLDGTPLGSARIQSNQFRPLNMEDSVELPDWLRSKSIGDIRRLGIVPGTIGRVVKLVLVKACFEYFVNNGLEWMVIAARPPLDRSYLHLLFQDILPGETFIPKPTNSNVPHRVLGLEIETAYARWTAAHHHLLDFFCNTYHPDINVGGPAAIERHHMVTQNYCWANVSGR